LSIKKEGDLPAPFYLIGITNNPMKYIARIRLDLIEYGVLLNKTTVLLES
jgi:hypothetical protein